MSGATLAVGQPMGDLSLPATGGGAWRRQDARDRIATHEKCRDKMSFSFPLLSDQDASVCGQFDVLRPKNLYGRQVIGIERNTFLLDAKGVLRRTWRKVRLAGHALEVLEAAQTL